MLREGVTSACVHCGLPVPAGMTEFCCAGCRTVYAILSREGMAELYAKTREGASAAAPESYEAFDDPAFLRLHSTPVPGGRSIELYVEGVHCAACVWLLEKLPRMVPGVREARLQFGRSKLTVVWDGGPLSEVAAFLDRLGYPAHAYRNADRRGEERRELIRIAVAGAVAGNTMGIAFALYGGAAEEYRTFFRWASLLLVLPSVFWAGQGFFRRAIGALRAGRLHMDLPISLGIATGFLWGAMNTIRGTGDVYLDSIAMLIFLLLAGRWLQHRQQRRAAESSELLFQLSPSTARLHGGREVPVETLHPGDRIDVPSGGTIPVDGEVESGTSDLDRSVLTGESRPVAVAPGEAVHAGTVNLTSPLVVAVRATGAETRVGQLMRQVEELSARKAPIQILADRISGVFVAVVVLLAAVAAIVAGIEPAVALLIVSCPCALGLATPLGISAALAKAARRGVLIKGGDTVEALSRPGTLWLDKTGTLTVGSLELVEWIGDEGGKPLVAALESGSSHPIARALCRALPAAPGPVRSFQRLGLGIAGYVNGEFVAVGSPEYQHPGPYADDVRRLAARGLTPVVVARGGHAVAVAGLGDPLHPDARDVVAKLRARGWRVGILSGDHPDVVASVARELGIDGRGACTPEEKLRAVRETSGPVVMVGDGVNDAAALTASTVGIAVHGGAEASLAAADIFFTRPGIGVLGDLFAGAARTMRVLRRGLIVSLLYNVAGVALAMAGVLAPWMAAILMPLSSLTVVWIAYRSRTFPCR